MQSHRDAGSFEAAQLHGAGQVSHGELRAGVLRRVPLAQLFLMTGSTTAHRLVESHLQGDWSTRTRELMLAKVTKLKAWITPCFPFMTFGDNF